MSTITAMSCTHDTTSTPRAQGLVPLADYRLAKAVAENNIRVFLRRRGDRSRAAMEAVVTAIMKNHRVNTMRFGAYWVRLLPGGGLAIGSRRTITGNRCPVCGRPVHEARYLGTAKERLLATVDLVTWGCRCGAVFNRCEPNGNGGNNA